MATYAPNGTVAEAPTVISLSSGRSPNRYHLMRILRKRGMRTIGEIISTLLEDSTPASEASITKSQVQANANTQDNVQGGVRTIETLEQMSAAIDTDPSDTAANTARNVTAADVTNLQEDLVTSGDRMNRAPTDGSGTITYATDASGNGGGGKQDAGR
jgi:hypothetical protein